MSKKESEGFKYKNPLDNPEDFVKLGEGMAKVRGKMHKYIEFNPKGVKKTEYKDAAHEEFVEMAKETLMLIASEAENFYLQFKKSLSDSHEVVMPLMLEKFIQAERRLLKAKKPEEFEAFERLLQGFFIAAEEVEDEQ